MSQEFSQIIEKLVQKTKEDGINWSETADSSTFLVSLGNYAVTIKYIDKPEEPSEVRFDLRSDKGRVIDTFIFDETDLSSFNKVADLWKLARRHALKIDQALKEVSRELDKQPVVDPPF